MASKKTTKKKLNIRKLFILLLFCYLFGCLFYYIYNEPIRNIIISGNSLVSDADIIEAAKIKDYPSIFGARSSKLKKSIKKINLIEDVIIKKDLKFRLKIEVKELRIVFLNSSSGKLMLNSGLEIDDENTFSGIPTLINYAPDDLLKSFTKELGQLDSEIIYLISEIEYSPKKSDNGDTVEEDSFTLYMNDGNTVITNYSKCSNLSHYREIYASLKDRKGILNLDSGNYENFVFIPY